MSSLFEQRQQQQSRLFEAIAATTPDFIYAFDCDGRVIYANRRLLEVWGVSAEGALGKSLYELGYPRWHADMHMRELRQVTETKEPKESCRSSSIPCSGRTGGLRSLSARRGM
jgi:PAS domain S-box-containing protein